jgi:hypothetical protein
MADEFQNGESNATTTIDEARSEPSHSLTIEKKNGIFLGDVNIVS